MVHRTTFLPHKYSAAKLHYHKRQHSFSGQNQGRGEEWGVRALQFQTDALLSQTGAGETGEEWIRDPHNHGNRFDKSRYKDLDLELIIFEVPASETGPGNHCPMG